MGGVIETRNEGEGGKKWIRGKRTGDAAVSVREREREREVGRDAG